MCRHDGPNYGEVPTGAVQDQGSAATDNARGPDLRVEWTDGLNQKHVVTVFPNCSVTVAFPLPPGGTWFWFQSGGSAQQRTGFNAAVTWIVATFCREDHSFRDPSVRIQSVGYRTEPANPGLWGDIKDRVKDVSEIAAYGAQTAADVARIAAAAGLLIP